MGGELTDREPTCGESVRISMCPEVVPASRFVASRRASLPPAVTARSRPSQANSVPSQWLDQGYRERQQGVDTS